MNLKHFLLIPLLAAVLIACNGEPISPEPSHPPEIPQQEQQEEVGTLLEYPEPEVVEPQEKETEWTAPENYRSDEETWDDTGHTIRLKGCIEWKKANPEADC